MQGGWKVAFSAFYLFFVLNSTCDSPLYMQINSSFLLFGSAVPVSMRWNVCLPLRTLVNQEQGRERLSSRRDGSTDDPMPAAFVMLPDSASCRVLKRISVCA